ncbi:citrate/2-methylcitrate synthase [Paenibacillus kobensis]|uniref:citrate/2-methylcitrate synthase n=1 Tax=Paenibacillus kobensis TaxID=59841 RepID=UPI000FD8CC6D|nr:citrate/2-methylcitrate synthase [Paenibacillus kobensis]
MTLKKEGGLADVVAGQTSISTVGKKGKGLSYRGYAIQDLARYGSFEETAYLLLYGELPNEDQLFQFQSRLDKKRGLPANLCAILEKLPAEAHPMDVLRTGISALGSLEPEGYGYGAAEIAERLIACSASIILYWRQYHTNKIRIGTELEGTVAEHFLQLLHGRKPSKQHAHALDTSLTLYAEHEFNASTFAARVTASTQSDFYSAVTTGIGTLRGNLHGGANEAAMELIGAFSSAEEAEAGVQQMLLQKRLIMGFGHRVYMTSDPRSDLIKEQSRALSELADDWKLYDISERIEFVMQRKKKLFPNLDFYSASAYRLLGIPNDLFTPLFVISRLSGWTAHIVEQRSCNRLIRPNAEYVGRDRQPWIPLKERI